MDVVDLRAVREACDRFVAVDSDGFENSESAYGPAVIALTAALADVLGPAADYVAALRDICFEIGKGESGTDNYVKLNEIITRMRARAQEALRGVS